MKGFADSVFAQTGARVQQGVSLRAAVLALGAMAVVPVLVVIGIAWQLQYRALQQRAAQDVATLAHLIAASQEQVIEGARQLLITVSNAPAVAAGDWAACNAFLRSLDGKFPNYVTVGVIDAGGALACQATPTGAPVGLGDRDYFREAARTGAFTLGEYQVGRITGSKTIAFAMPVPGPDAAPRAVAFAGMDLRALDERLHAVPLTEGVAAWLTDGHGTVLASAGTKDAPVGTPVPDPMLAHAIGDGVTGLLGAHQASAGFVQYIRPIAVAGGGRLFVAVSASRSEIVTPASRELGLLMAAIVAFLLLYAGLIRVLGGRWLVGPLRRLAADMHAIELGSYDRLAPSGRGVVREMLVLDRGLHAMWEGLHRRGRERDEAMAESDAAHDEMWAVLNQMDDGFLILDWSWQVKFCNVRGAQLVRSELATLPGRAFWSLFPDDAERKVRDICEREVALRHAWSFEEFHPHYGRWFEIRFFPAEDGIGVFLRDSTRQWTLMEELVEREQRYRELFEANPNIMWIHDAHTLAFLAVNTAAVARYGYSEDAFLSMTLYDIVPPDDREELAEYAARAERPGKLSDVARIWRHVTRAGEEMLVEEARHPVIFKGRDARLSMVTDATARLVAESRQRREMQSLAARHAQAEAAAAAQAQLLAGYARLIGDDVLPLLRDLQGTAGLLTAPALQRQLNALRQRAQPVRGVLEETQRLARIAGMPLQLEELDIAAMAREAVASLRAREPARIAHVEIEPGLPCRGDTALVRLLVEALVDNAWKATARQGDGWIRVGRYAPVEGAGGEAVHTFYVSDNGIGFDMAHEQRAFAPFERLHSPGDFAGQGLGLAVARAAAQRHGGRIWVRSTPGQGSTFCFELQPRPRAAARALVSEVLIDSSPPWDD